MLEKNPEINPDFWLSEFSDFLQLMDTTRILNLHADCSVNLQHLVPFSVQLQSCDGWANSKELLALRKEV